MHLNEFSLPEYCLDGENVLDHLGEVVAMDVALGTDYAATIVELLRCRPIHTPVLHNEWQASNRALQLLGERIKSDSYRQHASLLEPCSLEQAQRWITFLHGVTDCQLYNMHMLRPLLLKRAKEQVLLLPEAPQSISHLNMSKLDSAFASKMQLQERWHALLNEMIAGTMLECKTEHDAEKITFADISYFAIDHYGNVAVKRAGSNGYEELVRGEYDSWGLISGEKLKAKSIQEIEFAPRTTEKAPHGTYPTLETFASGNVEINNNQLLSEVEALFKDYTHPWQLTTPNVKNIELIKVFRDVGDSIDSMESNRKTAIPFLTSG